jgi:hypothetical protein
MTIAMTMAMTTELIRDHELRSKRSRLQTAEIEIAFNYHSLRCRVYSYLRL